MHMKVKIFKEETSVSPAVSLSTGLALQVRAGVEQVDEPLLPLLEAGVDPSPR